MSSVTWKINQLDREISDGFVFCARWQAYAGTEALMASTGGSVLLDRPQHLIPYADLTEPMVIGWVKEILGPELVDEIEAKLEAGYAELLNPQQAAGVPW